MLQQPWVVQLIVGIFALAFLWLGIILFRKSEKSDYNVMVLLRIISIVLWLGTLVGTAYLCYNVFWLNWTYFSIPTIILLVTAGVVVTLVSLEVEIPEDSEIGGYWGGAILVVVLSFIFIPLVTYMIDDQIKWYKRYDEQQAQLAAQREYYANVKPAELPKYREEEIELLSATDGSKVEGSLDGNIKGNFSKLFFVASGSMNGNINGEIKEIDVYKFYYYANPVTGEVRRMTLNADSTPIFFTKEGETPHLLKKVWTYYSLDYNVEPAQECNFSEKFAYELHVPEGSVVDVFEFNMQ